MLSALGLVMGGACGNCSSGCGRDAHRNMNTQPSDHTMPDAGMLKNKRRRSTEYRRMLSQNRSLRRLSTSPYTSNGEGPPETNEADEPCKEIDDIDEDEEMMGYSETEEDTSMTTSTTTSPSKIDHNDKEKGKVFRTHTLRKWNVQELDDVTQDMEGALLRLMKRSSGGTNRSDYLYSDSVPSGSHISSITLERSKSTSLPAVSTRQEVMANAKRAAMSPNGRGKKFRGHTILDMDSPHFGYESRTTSSSSSAQSD